MEALTASRAGTVAPPAVALRLLSDERLARLAAGGSKAAFAAIFERHHQALHRYCHSVVGNGHDAADALQNTMVKALRALPGETREIALKPWLYRIAHNESISLLRARRPDSNLDAAAHVGDRAADGVLESRQRLRDLTADLRELTEQQRGALLMRELGGLEFTDVAGALTVSAVAAKQSVYEARCALHAMQEGRAMDCDVMRRALSDGDRRTLRAMKMRSHLRACAGCRDFETALRHRPAQLAAIVPPLPVGLAAAMLHSVLGVTGHGGGGGLAAGLSAGAGQGGSGGLAASLGAAGAKASGALTLGAAKVAAVVVVAGSVAGGAVYVAPHGQSTRTAPSALAREAASGSTAVTSLSAAQTVGRVAETSPAATKKAETARALAQQQPEGAAAATPSGAAAGREQSADDVAQAPPDANSSASGLRDLTSPQQTQVTAPKPATTQNRPVAAKTPSTAAGAPSTAVTSRPTSNATCWRDGDADSTCRSRVQRHGARGARRAGYRRWWRGHAAPLALTLVDRVP